MHRIFNTLTCNHKVCDACYERLETTTNACPMCQETLNSKIKIEKRPQEMTDEEVIEAGNQVVLDEALLNQMNNQEATNPQQKEVRENIAPTKLYTDSTI